MPRRLPSRRRGDSAIHSHWPLPLRRDQDGAGGLSRTPAAHSCPGSARKPRKPFRDFAPSNSCAILPPPKLGDRLTSRLLETPASGEMEKSCRRFRCSSRNSCGDSEQPKRKSQFGCCEGCQNSIIAQVMPLAIWDDSSFAARSPIIALLNRFWVHDKSHCGRRPGILCTLRCAAGRRRSNPCRISMIGGYPVGVNVVSELSYRFADRPWVMFGRRATVAR